MTLRVSRLSVRNSDGTGFTKSIGATVHPTNDDLRAIVAQAIEAADEAHQGSGFPCDCGWGAGLGRGWADRLRHHRRMAIADAAIATALADEREQSAAVIPDELLDLLASLYDGARDNHWTEADWLAELVTGQPMTADEVNAQRFRDWLAATYKSADQINRVEPKRGES